MAGDKKQIAGYVPEELFREIDHAAEKSGMNRSDWLREAAREKLEREKFGEFIQFELGRRIEEKLDESADELAVQIANDLSEKLAEDIADQISHNLSSSVVDPSSESGSQ
jgi:hypothetical protein